MEARMKDSIISVRVEGIPARFFAVNSKDAVKDMQRIHSSSYTATAAAGRVISAVAMMSMALKNEKDRLSVQIKCDGPIKGIVAVANSAGEVKIDIHRPDIYLPLKANGKLDVAAAVGKGTMTVVRDLGLKNPYVGTVDITSGEIAEDFTYYFATSEQTPSVVSLGVLIGEDDAIKASGGYMIQLMPGCPEDVVKYLEEKISSAKSVTSMLETGMDPVEMIESIFPEKRVELIDKKSLAYKCDCSRMRIRDGLAMIKKEELADMISEDNGAEVVCHFCNTKYDFTVDELKKIMEKSK
jgi:molecular chaperone Hsp33